MKQKLLLFATTILLLAFQLKSQTLSKITGQIKDNNGNSVSAATVTLHKAKDSGLVKTAVTDKAGNYELLSIKPGNYFIRTSITGMQKTSAAIFEVKENETTTVAAITVT